MLGILLIVFSNFRNVLEPKNQSAGILIDDCLNI